MKKIIAIALSATMTVGIMNVPAYAELTGFKGIGQISVKAAPEELTYGDFKYVVENGGVTIKEYTGMDSIVTVPDRINGQDVLEIGASAFSECKNLEEIQLSENVRIIGFKAFYNCSSLRQIKLPSKLKSMGERVFEGTKITSITIPKTLENALCALAGAKNLKEVIIEEGMEKIPASLMSVDTDNRIQEVQIPSSVKEIGSCAFKNCACLTEMNFGKELKEIGSCAFEKCKGLKKISFSDNVDKNYELTIRFSAFSGCINLEEIRFSDNIIQIEDSAFCNCSNLKQINLPSKLKSMGARVFKHAGIRSITIPKTLEKAGGYYNGALAGAKSLKEVIIEEGMTEVPDELVYDEFGDNGIQKIQIPSTVKRIGYRAFSGCKNLKEIMLSDNIRVIDSDAFYNCNSLKQIKLPSKLESMYDRVFGGTGITSITIPKTLKYVATGEGGTLAGAKNLKEVIIEEGMIEIPLELMHVDSDNQIQKIQIPSSVKKIGSSVFKNCKGITIYGYKNSYAETYARKNNIPFAQTGIMIALDDYDKYQANYLSQNAESITAGQMIYSDLEDNYTPTQYASNSIANFIWNSKFKFSDHSQVWETVLMDAMLRKSYDKEASDTFLKNSAKMAVKVLKFIDGRQGIKETAKLTQENKREIRTTLKDAKIEDVEIMSGMLDAAETTKDFADKYTKYLELKKEVSSDTTEFLKEMKSTKNYREIPAFQRALNRIIDCMDTNRDDMLGKIGQVVLKNESESMLFTEAVNTLIENSMDILLPGMTKILNITKDTTMYIMDSVCGVSQLAEVNLYLYMLDCIDESAKEAFHNCAAKNIASDGEEKVNAINGGMQFIINLQTYGVSVGRKRADQIVKKVLELTTSNSVTTVNNPYRDLVNARLNLKTGSKREEKKKYIENKCQENEKWITGVKNLKTFAFLNWYEETNTDDNMALLMFVVENPDGSKNIYAKQKVINTKIEFPTPEAKTGYTASKSWYTDEECKHAVSGSQTVSGNANFYTKYTHNILFDKTQKGEIKINKFDRTYYLNGKKTGKTRAVQNAKKCEIPSYIDGYKVTELGEDIFSELPDMTEIYIPPTVKTINKDAFKSLPKETLYRCDKKSYAEDFLHDNKYKNVRVEDNTPKPKTVKVSQIKLTGISNKIAAGKKIKLTSTINPKNATKKTLKWTTNNKKLATVDKNGVVTINKKAGGKTVKITAEATDGSKKKATFTIKIMKGVVKKVKISGSKTVKSGKTLKLKAKVTASKGANKSLKWTSSNTKYATVTSSGKVKALKAGKKKTVKITAMAVDGSGKKATFKVKIK